MSAKGTCFLHLKMWRNTTRWCLRRRQMVHRTLKVCQVIAFRQFCSRLLIGVCVRTCTLEFPNYEHACVRSSPSGCTAAYFH